MTSLFKSFSTLVVLLVVLWLIGFYWRHPIAIIWTIVVLWVMSWIPVPRAWADTNE